MNKSFLDLTHDSIRTLEPYQPGKPISELRRELGVQDIIKLASNENALGASPVALTAARQALDEIALYPDANGYELKSALSEYLTVDKKQLTLGNGSDSLFLLTVQAFVKPGEEVMVSEYGFITYSIIARGLQAKLITVPAKSWGVDLSAMLKAVTPATRVIFIANPNNPTGSWVKHQELQDFLEKLPAHVFVVIDEAYYEYAADQPDYPNSLALQKKFTNLIITRTFSKVYGLASLRVGYAITHQEITDILNRIRLPFNVCQPALSAASAALSDQKFVKKTLQMNLEGQQLLTEGFKKLKLKYLPSVGNFFTIDLEKDAKLVFQALLQLGVIVRPLANYNMPKHLRITIGLPHENERLLDCLKKVLL